MTSTTSKSVATPVDAACHGSVVMYPWSWNEMETGWSPALTRKPLPDTNRLGSTQAESVTPTTENSIATRVGSACNICWPVPVSEKTCSRSRNAGIKSKVEPIIAGRYPSLGQTRISQSGGLLQKTLPGRMNGRDGPLILTSLRDIKTNV